MLLMGVLAAAACRSGGAISRKGCVMARTLALSISYDTVCQIVAKDRQFVAKDLVTEPYPGSNPSDDGMIEVLEDHADDPVYEELVALINMLGEDEQIDLVTMTWLGRGDGAIEEWDELRQEAARSHNRRTAEYLLGLPLLSQYLEEALSQFGYSCNV
jgi:hypothetical protein